MKVLLNSGLEAMGPCHRERVGAGPGIGDRDADVAKEGVGTSWRSWGLLSYQAVRMGHGVLGVLLRVIGAQNTHILNQDVDLFRPCKAQACSVTLSTHVHAT